MFNFEDRIDLIFKTGFFNFQFNFSRALALGRPAGSAGSRGSDPGMDPRLAGRPETPARTGT